MRGWLRRLYTRGRRLRGWLRRQHTRRGWLSGEAGLRGHGTLRGLRGRGDGMRHGDAIVEGRREMRQRACRGRSGKGQDPPIVAVLDIVRVPTRSRAMLDKLLIIARRALFHELLIIGRGELLRELLIVQRGRSYNIRGPCGACARRTCC